jgi:hypothetical protein
MGYFGLDNLNFTGSYEASALNYLTQKASSVSFEYFFIFLLLTIIMCFLYYIGKHINILISHKTGKTTLDTIFDDYDSEEVVKQLQQKETKKKNN